ncbi:homeobox-leucine zipper protein PROTODERMAL FACTOR 2-like [Impatiens glandulifera]|uniref:homeobox-leucine zipper protein PROTODERMAL FACTOR 2-like n=1 Tax=Impatiens glandulifera TaxID=253017 RepID=UPI001FB06D61|nr:homeobox-leucine zipper protein PROTODERMAL FACTOR 2-like [Impatiens glandulifera]
MKEFEMSDLGLLLYYMSIEVDRKIDSIEVKHETYVKKVLKQFAMEDCNSSKYPMEAKLQLRKDVEGSIVDLKEYRRIIGCLNYCSVVPWTLAKKLVERGARMRAEAALSKSAFLFSSILPSPDIPSWFSVARVSNIVSCIGLKLNEDEYFQIFPIRFGPRPESLYCESSCHSTTLNISSHSLLDFFMCQANWKCFLSVIVSKATCLEILSSGLSPGNYNGALQVTPFVHIRDNLLARYCRQVGEKNWVVVDVSLDIFREFHLMKSRKRPYGCIIEDMPNRFTNVTWIEHVEAQHVTDVHPIYKALVSSGLAFGTKRWLVILQSQIDRLFSVMSNTLPFSDITVAMSTESKRRHTWLSDRMVGIFNTGVSVTTGNVWNIIPYSGPNKIRVLKISNTDIPGRPVGVILVATYSK